MPMEDGLKPSILSSVSKHKVHNGDDTEIEIIAAKNDKRVAKKKVELTSWNIFDLIKSVLQI